MKPSDASVAVLAKTLELLARLDAVEFALKHGNAGVARARLALAQTAAAEILIGLCSEPDQ